MDKRKELETKKQNLILRLQESGKNFTEAYEAWAAADGIHKIETLIHRNRMNEKWWITIQEISGVTRELETLQGEIQTRREIIEGEVEKLETWIFV